MTESPRKTTFTLRWFVWRLGSIFVISIVGLGLLSITSKQPSGLGVTNGRLANCPDMPNCVSTDSQDETQKMAVIEFSGSAEDQLEKLKQIVAEDFPRAKLIRESEYYLQYEFKSLVFRFVDDVEFLVDDARSTIHFRSAARVGHSDMGVNRKRMEKIVERMLQ